jgi:Cysteine rich repeat
MFSKYGLWVAVGIFVSMPALAEGGLMQGACMSDIKSLCGSIQPGGGRIRDCMKEHRTQLSIACKAAIADRMLEHGRSQSAGASAVVRTVPKAGD